jgi:predicted Zn-dependent protease
MKRWDREQELMAMKAINEAKQLYEDGRYDDAIAAATKARRSYGGPPLDRVMGVLRWSERIQGLSHLALSHPKDAVAALRVADRNFRGDAYVRAKLGQALVANGELKEGQQYLEKLAGNDMLPDAGTWVALAKARKAAGDGTGAADAAKHALERDAANAEAKALLAELTTPPPTAPVKPAATKTSSKPSI